MEETHVTDYRLTCGWWRHTKAMRLRRRCGADGLLSLLILWDYCAEHRSTGSLSDMDDEEIEIAAWWDGEPGQFVAAIVDVGYLDGDCGSRTVHDWVDHQPWL